MNNLKKLCLQIAFLSVASTCHVQAEAFNTEKKFKQYLDGHKNVYSHLQNALSHPNLVSIESIAKIHGSKNTYRIVQATGWGHRVMTIVVRRNDVFIEHYRFAKIDEGKGRSFFRECDRVVLTITENKDFSYLKESLYEEGKWNELSNFLLTTKVVTDGSSVLIESATNAGYRGLLLGHSTILKEDALINRMRAMKVYGRVLELIKIKLKEESKLRSGE